MPRTVAATKTTMRPRRHSSDASTALRHRSLIILTIALSSLLDAADALFGNKKRKAEEAARVAALEAERLSKLVSIGGFEVPKWAFYSFTVAVAVFLSYVIFSVAFGEKKKRGNRPNDSNALDVVVVGCGLPKKGMGWYHLTQLLDMTNANVRAVVEPFYLDEQRCKSPPQSFLEMVESIGEKGVPFVKSVQDLDDFTKPTMCLIAGRTNDNPTYFDECLSKGAKVIYLEKPGAPTVSELKRMKTLATSKSVKVYVGYNKNVTPYVQKAVALSRKVEHSHVFFCHNNSYSPSDLPEVFTRNSEGMLQNMAVHELALLVTFFDVTVDKIDKFKVNTSKLFSEKLTIWKPGTSMPNPEYITDFSRAAFKITTKSGTNVSVMADRCGGNVSFAVVKDENGREVQKFEFPDDAQAKVIAKKVKDDPEMMPYFFVQSEDYLELKRRVVKAALDGTDAEGVATITVAIEAMRLAEYGTEQLNKALKAS